MADQKQFEDALSRVVHPDYGKNIVELGLITDLAVANGSVAFQLQNTVANTERGKLAPGGGHRRRAGGRPTSPGGCVDHQSS